MKRTTTTHRRSARVFVLLCWALAAYACGGKAETSALATVNGREVTKAEFDAYLKVKRISGTAAGQNEHVLREYLEREALADAIVKEGKLDAAEIKAEVREFEKQLLLTRHFDALLEDKVSDTAVRNYYSQNADRYEEKKVRVAHVLLRMNPQMSEEERKAKLTAAQEAYAKLRAGEDFAAVAQAMSDDKVSARKGGEIGWLRDDSIDPRFAKKVFAMQKDELSEPFETSFGFHVVKVLEAAQTLKKPFESVQGDIRYQLRAEAKDAEMKRLQAGLKVEQKGAPVKPEKSGEQAAARRD